MSIPMKFFVLKCIANQEKPSSYKDILPLVQERYPNERQVNQKNLIIHLEAFSAVGATTVVDAYEEEGNLYMTYELTEYGKNLLKYIKE